MSTPPSINIINDPNHPGMALMSDLITAINAATTRATAERPLTAGTVLDVLYSIYGQILVNTPRAWNAVPEAQASLRDKLQREAQRLEAQANQQTEALLSRVARCAPGANPSTPAT